MTIIKYWTHLCYHDINQNKSVGTYVNGSYSWYFSFDDHQWHSHWDSHWPHEEAHCLQTTFIQSELHLQFLNQCSVKLEDIELAKKMLLNCTIDMAANIKQIDFLLQGFVYSSLAKTSSLDRYDLDRKLIVFLHFAILARHLHWIFVIMYLI